MFITKLYTSQTPHNYKSEEKTFTKHIKHVHLETESHVFGLDLIFRV